MALAPAARAEGWRGITPLRSTRADVERLLGKHESESEAGSAYATEGERVTIIYARRPCDYGWRVPPDTVISFFVRPKRPPKLSEFKLDEKRYERRRDVHVETLHYYVDQQEGVNYTVDSAGGVVTGVEYYPPLKDKALLCRPTAAKPGDAPAPSSPASTNKPAAKRDADGRARRSKSRRRP